MKKKNNKNFEEKNILPSNENIEVGTDSGFDDLMYDNLESDYQYFDGNNFDDEKVEKPVSEELCLSRQEITSFCLKMRMPKL